jgi:hypothetical protein
LQTANHLTGIFHHGQALIGVSVNRGKGREIGRVRWVSGILAPLTQLVIGQKHDDSGQIRPRGAAEKQRHARNP